MTSLYTTSVATAHITQLYQSVYGRTPDAAGLASWTAALQNGKGISAIRSIFATSSEAQAKLNLAYRTVFNAPLSSVQLLAYESALTGGASFAQVTAPWLNAAQSQITQLYNNDIGRAPDQGGLASYSKAMLSGTSLASIRTIFAYSAAAAIALQTIYTKAYGAPMTAAQLAGDQYLLSTGSSLSQVTNSQMKATQTTVIAAYQGILNRTPTASELVNKTAGILNGISIASIRAVLANSPEAISALSTIYCRAFGSSPSQLQVANATSVIASGSTLAQVATSWINSSVNQLYQDVLGRAADANGLSAFVNAILGGSTYAQVRGSLASGSEVATKLQTAYAGAYGSTLTSAQLSSTELQLANGQTLSQVEAPWVPTAQAEIAQLYQDLLGRQADAAGLASYTNALLQGGSLQAIRNLFATSSGAAAQLTQAYENNYSQIITPTLLSTFEQQLSGGMSLTQVESTWNAGTGAHGTAEAQITNLYENVLGREPDAGGLSGYATALENGQSLQSIRASFAGSSEAAAHLSQSYENAYSQTISQTQLTQAQASLAAGASLTQVEAPWYTFVPGTTILPEITLSAVDPFVESVTGSGTTADFMNLFSSYGNWDSQVSAFKISTQFAMWGSAQQLQTLYSYLDAHHIGLELEGLMLPMTPGSTAGQGVEGFNGPPGSLGTVAARIASLGGHLQYIAMDEPLYFGHQYTGTNGPQESIATVAQQVAVSVAAVEKIFPNVKVGDVEPTPGTNDLKTWAADYQAAVGQPLAFFDADVPWTTGPYLNGLEQAAGEFRQMNVPFGVIINGNGHDTTDSGWVNTAEQRLAAIEADPLIRPEQLVVQTWGPNPSQVGPEGTAGSLTNLLGNVANIASDYANGSLASEQTGTVSLTGPATLNATVGISQIIAGLNLSATTTTGGSAQVGVVLLTNSGQLSTLTPANVEVTGNGTSALSLVGTATDIQTELAHLSYDNTTSGVDSLSITAYQAEQAPTSYELGINVQSAGGVMPSAIGSISSATFSHSQTFNH